MSKIAVLGFGVVGSGVVEILGKHAGCIRLRQGDIPEVKYILDIRDFVGVNGNFIKEFSLIENDDEVSIVAETIGGIGAAYEFTKRAILSGKHVVTPNKELVAVHGAELLRLAKENGVKYLFEASVGGGIPIVRPMLRCLSANRITEISGIMNGTCNYILTRMENDSLGFDQALLEAQQKGYAEADPAADIEGKDTCRKICILASIALGKHVYPQNVQVTGIAGITLEVIKEARKKGYAVKLLGRVSCAESAVQASVEPYLVPRSHPFYMVSDVFNAVMVTGSATGEVMFFGRGAGKLPTASAVVADILECCEGDLPEENLFWTDSEGGRQPFGVPISVNKYTFDSGFELPILQTDQF
ncbi:MAG: homoserine dehydrogenase [Oscillospiraceae bacterium]|nr:homoserine dehydrogenase [Oscillospiraceae bacterium]